MACFTIICDLYRISRHFSIVNLTPVTFIFVHTLSGAPDNRGTEFVIGFPPSRSAEQNAYINVTTSKPHDITVYVTAPRFPEANLNETFIVRQGLVISVTVSHLLRGSGDSRKRLESKAIQITGKSECNMESGSR